MSASLKIKSGDWVRFISNNTPVIAEVLYVKDEREFAFSMQGHIVTDRGHVNRDSILEVRSSDQSQLAKGVKRERPDA